MKWESASTSLATRRRRGWPRPAPRPAMRRSSADRASARRGRHSRSPAPAAAAAGGPAPAARDVWWVRSTVTDASADRGSAPPPICARPLPTVAVIGRPSSAATMASARGRRAATSSRSMSTTGTPPAAAQVQIDRRLERGEGQLVAPERAKQRLALERGDHRPAPGDDARLRAAEQLVAAEADEIHALAQYRGGCRLRLEAGDRAGVEHRPAAEILDQRHPSLAGDRGNRLEWRRGHEARP